MKKSNSREAYIVSAGRTPLGQFGGAFKSVRAAELSAVVAEEVADRAGIAKSQVDEIVWGECHQQADQCNTARVMAVKAGFPKDVPSFTINKVCTSAMRAIIRGVQAILLEDADIVLAGGVECMSFAPTPLGLLAGDRGFGMV